MKTYVRLLQFVASAGAVILAPAGLTEESAPEVKAAFIEPDSAETRSIRDVGGHAIDRLAVTLITDVSNAVTRDGLVAALDQCHLKDVPTKDGLVGGMPRITAAKMTSLKIRSPANAPDAAEKLALNRVRIGLLVDNPPSILLQRIELPDGKIEWRVYKPLANIPQCGVCHAKPDKQPPELREALQKRYPNDEASAYELGEWRGLVRVTVAEANPPTPAAPKAVKPRPVKSKS